MKQRHKNILHEDLSCLEDILEFAQSIEKIVCDITFQEFDIDMLKYLSTARLFEMIGEATKNISNEVRNNYSCIEWKSMAGMRDILIHAYRNTDNMIVWDVAVNKVPVLINDLKKVIKELKSEE